MKVFGVDYHFLSCGAVFTDGLARAADDIGLDYRHAAWDVPDLDQQILAFAPDLLFVVHGRRFAQRYPNFAPFGVKTAVWLLDEPYEVDDTSSWSWRFDHVFVNDASSQARHSGAVTLPVCYDPAVHRYAADDPRGYRVGFIGGGNSTRDRYLSALAEAELLDYVVGGFWADPQVQRRCLAHNIKVEHTARLYRQTRIVLNVFREQHHFNVKGLPATAMNPRIYEAIACGALVVSEWRPEIAERLPELPTFHTEQQAVALMRQLLADPERSDLLRAACERRLRGDTYAARLRKVVSTAWKEAAA